MREALIDPSDYQKRIDFSADLRKHMNKFSDTYMEGEIGAVIDDGKGKDIPIGTKRTLEKVK